MKTPWVILVLIASSWCVAAHGQILRGEWVDQSQRDIETHRMTDLHVLVLDLSGKHVPHARVHIEQLEHAFAWGVVWDDAMLPADRANRSWRDEPVWRCFNAVALDRVTAWPRMQPDAATHNDDAVDAALKFAEADKLRVRFGGVSSANPEYLPDWVVQLDDAALREALEARTAHVLARYGRRIDAFDLHTHLADHQLVQARLGVQMLRNLHEFAKATAPDATVAVRYDNAMTGTRLQAMLQAHAALTGAFVPFDEIVFDEEVSGTVVQAPLSRAMAALGELDTPIVVGRLEVSGSSPTAAAVNMETMLRVLFAAPAVEGIYLSGVTVEQVGHANAALVEGGKPTGSGEVFDALVRKLWWTDEQVQADELGNVRTRVFAGAYRITATLPDGRVARMTVRVPKADRPRLVMLQPLPVAETDAPPPDAGVRPPTFSDPPPSEGDELFH